LEAEDFSLPREPRPVQPDAASDGLNLGSVERNTIQQALSQHEGNVSRAAQSLGLTLVRQIAAVHEASVALSDTPGGGATLRKERQTAPGGKLRAFPSDGGCIDGG
jgi:light-regulated signal transduction histidine kinase (bacteriophytochrome)